MPTSTFCVLPSRIWAQSGIPCSLILASATLTWLPPDSNGWFLCLEEVVHEDVPAVLAFLPSSEVLHRILLSRSPKKLKPILHLGLEFCYVLCVLISITETLLSHGCYSQGCPQPLNSWPALPGLWVMAPVEHFLIYLIDYLTEIILKTLQKSPGLLAPSPTAVPGRLKSPMYIRACIHLALFSWVKINSSLIDFLLPRSKAFPLQCYYLCKRLV